MFYEEIKREQQSMEKRIARVEEKLEGMPEGKLVCTRNRNGFKWYVSDGKNYTYISSKEREIAERLAEKKYYCNLQAVLNNKKKALDKCSNVYLKNDEMMKQFMEKNPGVCKLLNFLQKDLSETLVEWVNEEYKTNTSHPEDLVHKSSWGEVFRSKSESMIAKCLRERGIPYRYECALRLGDETVYPDFTIRHPRTGRIYYYEHFGKMDDVKYTNRNLPKIPLYTKHGIIPGIHLIMTFETQAEPLSMYTIEKILSQYFE